MSKVRLRIRSGLIFPFGLLNGVVHFCSARHNLFLVRLFRLGFAFSVWGYAFLKMSCFCHVSLYPCAEKGVVFAKDGRWTLSCMPTTNSGCCLGLCLALDCSVLHFIWRGMLLWCGLLFALGRSFVCLSALFCFKVFCSVLTQNWSDVLLCFCLVCHVLDGSGLFRFYLPCLYLKP